MFLLVYIAAVVVICGNACSWDSCFEYSNDPNVIKVHLVCHSHDDMGWLKTVDDYYTGRTKSIVNVGVEYIYNTVIEELAKDPNKKFSFAEVGYLTRWLEGRDKNDAQVIKLKDLIKNGQVEFIGGGWVQNDEAAAHYIDIVGQYSFGANKLLDYFGKCVPPKIAWQVDPFGHSREHANIVALFGYEGLIHGRMHYQGLADRINNKSLDYLWVTSDDLKMELPTTAFYSNMYHAPQNFCFDTRCADDPVVDDEKLEGYNVNQKRDDFINKIKDQAKSQQHNHVLVTLGGDFQYSDANVPFTSYDRLIKAVNAVTGKTNVQIFYSTPSCYMQTVNKIVDKLTKKVDDHFPYASSAHSYWSGYFTSKPEHKYMIRQLSNLLQLGKAMRVFGNLTEKKFVDAEETAERALSLSQHHDAVTGTSKEKVTQDYERRLRIGANGIQKILSSAVKKLTSVSKFAFLLS
ncbi:Alpha-mann-mid domain-containing protein [Aphelenchoides bicaudatus]|nr:Alpha-mann-mid domain-containing protein [Aphelenchoides bicaudatus]